MPLEQLWICNICGSRNGQIELACTACGEFRAPDAQLVEVGDPDSVLFFVVLDPANGYNATQARIQIPDGDGTFMVGRNHSNPDRSGGRVNPEIDLYDHLVPYNGSSGRSYGVSKFQAVVRRNGDVVTIERYKKGASPFYEDASEIKLCVVNGGSLVVSKTGDPGEQFTLSPGSVWQFGNDPKSDPARKAPGIAVMLIEEKP